ncbi:glutamyl-tRNA amidotransferase [Mycoplasma sp. NEAQ87857]|uniref:Asp-tRNA(Asn)/Glu-tRNA(Gln) amidotransferase subunit GatC n=1 Tax=Mycoplasma sp. NEAQ87857 TaxID=2683967 RepID=UPI001317054A|nr:Asp-tRNA(Asn)/Glu-tRNA(Gln) amidotransferase subunit GatC [Mycoplasma sp. NEAQ87857]QGZ97301.1 glutamyl-tRNA amidotransferase [Mycoplasma sp. NEAQ87857]
MQTMNKEKLIEIVSSLMLEPTDEVIENILNNWTKLQNELKSLDKLDLANVKPLTHINEELKIDFLREDIEDTSYAISKQDILKNAKDADDDYIILTKVVK